MKKVIIIGAGVGGLATAALLALKGYKVIVLEKNSVAGGRAMLLESNGFKFDMGPSWYLMPQVFDDFFKRFSKKTSDFYELKKLDPSYRIFFENDNKIDIKSNLESNRETFEQIEKGSFNKLQQLLDVSENQYKTSMKYFVNKNFKSIFDVFNWDSIKYGKNLKVFKTIDSHIRTYFKSEKLIKVILYSVLFLGGIPKKTPAIFSMMSYIDYKLGVWYPMGGMNKVVESLYNLGKKYGVEFKFNANVESINIENGLAKSVSFNGELLETDIVVSNADYAFTETKLLKKEYQTYNLSYWNGKLMAPSAFVIYLGINKKINNLLHHSIILANDWNLHFSDDIINEPKWPENPSIYVCCPSKTDSSVAPIGYENIFITIPIAVNLEDTIEIREKYKNKVIKIIENSIGEKFSDSIIYSKIVTVNDYKSLYNAYKGTAVGLAPTLFQSAFFKPKNTSKKVKNLYYVGQYVNPGSGVPMCLISAQLATDLIIQNESN